MKPAAEAKAEINTVRIRGPQSRVDILQELDDGKRFLGLYYVYLYAIVLIIFHLGIISLLSAENILHNAKRQVCAVSPRPITPPYAYEQLQKAIPKKKVVERKKKS